MNGDWQRPDRQQDPRIVGERADERRDGDPLRPEGHPDDPDQNGTDARPDGCQPSTHPDDESQPEPWTQSVTVSGVKEAIETGACRAVTVRQRLAPADAR